MNGTVDLHTHSKASDGSFTPSGLIRYAAEKGLRGLALTDHDTVDGIPEALEEVDKLGMAFIPGVEISADYETEMHILAYFTRDTYRNIAGTLSSLRRNREERNPKILRKLSEMGMHITVEELDRKAAGSVAGRPHIAQLLLEKGHVRSFAEAFERYLGDGKPAYFKKDKLSPEESIRQVLQAGGIPVLAHPILMRMSYGRLDALVGRLAESGLKGLEAYYVENTRDDTGNLLRLAVKYRLIPTGGSDFHGTFKHDIEIGIGRGNLEVPFSSFESLKKALEDGM